MMDNDIAKLRKSRRIARTDAAIKRQQRIAKAAGVHTRHEDQPHRYHKHHALDCGVPGCMRCSNARKTHGERTVQERKFIEGNKDDARNS